ncbi:Tripartite-type tricarboxylate transporter, receptor component TctC [Noviherbaspirillum humi]|uniref:Tripartite-type tricarboxylate transporter, receptor component TctC n=1 Tax=Noviherbaspirillum humi TaxID=1688639 RepID=A0A239KY96_9BURK|nr:tripartite tricarboxylate transporter substrate binding protein BugD [Noviherbaspirillum humi]SNT22990.1 Tripartite-type tricarboxylate transporter, receptor component TctC [Noviherbaspirillum humi]
MKNMLRFTLAAATLVTATAASAQTYPTKPITMVIPFAAGGPTDVVGRLIAQSMSKTLGQQVIVENTVGAGGTIAAARVAHAQPDGYTILLHHIGQSTAPSLYRKLSFDPLTSFETAGLVTEVPMTVVARGNFPAKDFSSMVQYIKANKDKINLANAGTGSASHLCGMLFQHAINTQFTTIPYKGTGPAMNDLLGGQVDIMCDQTTNTTSYIKSGKIKAYAVTTPKRLAVFPDLPTTREAGVQNFEVSVWHGLYAPKGTPRPVIDKINGALKVALKDQLVIDRFAGLGTEPVAENRTSPEVHKQFLQSEIAKWKTVIQQAGVQPE